MSLLPGQIDARIFLTAGEREGGDGEMAGREGKGRGEGKGGRGGPRGRGRGRGGKYFRSYLRSKKMLSLT